MAFKISSLRLLVTHAQFTMYQALLRAFYKYISINLHNNHNKIDTKIIFPLTDKETKTKQLWLTQGARQYLVEQRFNFRQLSSSPFS